MTKPIYFASDFHLGLDSASGTSRQREDRIIRWLDSILEDAAELYILGDLFDYWFEYKKVVPKGFVRVLAKLSQFTERDIPLHIFTGNHDMWMFDYLENEIGANIYREPILRELGGQKFFLGHGDGLGPGDHGYKFIKKVFRSKINQWLFARLHPNFGIGLMQRMSKTSRDSQDEQNLFLGAEKEWLVQFCEKHLKSNAVDYYIFGHRHLPIDHELSEAPARYINCGDWINHNTYVVYHQGKVELKKFS